ncbi:MAG: TraM recognition domain-containing protein, partial [Deltaproteobacteria bacterium]|nr:TraM recognition domain-containing protein [Deltaproteobacteria bacterium]
GPTWANLFELARKGRFALLFGAQSAGGLTDSSLGLSEAFYERVMANVNLKVMMRVGDNRTAQEMTDWIGKVNTTKKSVGAGVTSGTSGAILRGAIDPSSRSTAGESQTVSLSEDEEDLVSSEELKHEMSAEKGLAWFDLGDGRIVKGRAFWFNADIPDTWEGREFLTHFEKNENDEIGLAEWVDEQILSQEQRETNFHFGSAATKTAGNAAAEAKKTDTEKFEEPSGPFKISLVPRGGKPRGAVSAYPKDAAEPVEPEKKNDSESLDSAKAGAGKIDLSREQKKIAASRPAEKDKEPVAARPPGKAGAADRRPKGSSGVL